MELTVATFVASDFKQAEPYEGRLSCMVPWEGEDAILLPDPIMPHCKKTADRTNGTFGFCRHTSQR